MANRVLKSKIIKSSIFYFLGVSFLPFVSISHAQSTPSELADMALEDLLNFEITDENTAEAKDLRKRWQVSYTYRKLRSGGYKSGTNDLSFNDVLFSPGETRTGLNYPVVPTYICQDVHAFSAGYSLTANTSININVPFIQQGTDHISSVPGFSDFLLKSNGIGDIGIRANHKKQLAQNAVLQFSVGARLPVGSINETGDTPRNGSGTLERLPYTMQIGSGTLDFTGAVKLSKKHNDLSYGLGVSTTLRTGKNDNDYRLGNNYGASTWVQYSKNHWLQPGLRLSLRSIETIKGGDTSLTVPNIFPYPAGITDPNNYGGTKAGIAALIKVCPNTDCNVSFTGEYGKPIYQNLNGVQPKDRSYASITTSLKF